MNSLLGGVPDAGGLAVADGGGLSVVPDGLALGLAEGLGEAEGLVLGEAFAVVLVLGVQLAAKSKMAAKATPIRLPPVI